MRAAVSAGAGFLLAVLWFDLMFDTQVRGHRREVPTAALASISAYYRRATTEAFPMNRLVAVVMVLTLGALVAEVVRGTDPGWIGWVSLAATAAPIGLAGARTVRNAKRLGSERDPIDVQASLARRICRDHLFCLASIAVVLALQLSLPLWPDAS